MTRPVALRSTRRRDARGRVLPLAAGAVAGLALIAAAGFWGYRTQVSAWPTPARASAAPAAAGKAQGDDGFSRPASGYVAKPAAAPRAASGAAVQPPVLSWPLWEFLLRQPIPPRDPPLTPPAWRLIGATRSSGTWSIIVMRQGKTTPEYFKTGESLPGGYRIESITEEDVTLVKGKLPVVLSYIGSR